MTATYVILVNWNGRSDTIECLQSLMRLEADDFSVLIVDNGSHDGSVDAIRTWADAPEDTKPDGPVWRDMPGDRRLTPSLRIIDWSKEPDARPDDARITILQAGANLGFAGANNLGMRFAERDAGARYFWILNNDTVVRPDALSHLVAHAETHSDQGIIGATLLYYHRPEVVQGLGGWMRTNRALSGHIGFEQPAHALPPMAEVEASLSYVMGASMFVRRALYDRIGGMSEAYFLYFEELDWAKRLPADVRQGVCVAAVVYHKEGGSIGTSSVSRPSDTTLYYCTINMLRFFWLHERAHMHVAVARFGWNAVGYARRGDMAGVRMSGRVLADILTRRRRRGPYGSEEFRAKWTGGKS